MSLSLSTVDRLFAAIVLFLLSELARAGVVGRRKRMSSSHEPVVRADSEQQMDVLTSSE